MATGREINWTNKTDPVTSGYGVNQKLVAAEINELRDKHNAVDTALATVESTFPTVTQNASNALSQSNNNASSIGTIQNQIGDKTLGTNVPSNAVFTDTPPHAQATNQGNVFNASDKLLQLNSDGKVPDNLLLGKLSLHKDLTGMSISGPTVLTHLTQIIESTFTNLNVGDYFTFSKGYYLIDVQFDYVVPEAFTIKLWKNAVLVETNKCTHKTSFATYVALPTDQYTISIESITPIVIQNTQIKILRS